MGSYFTECAVHTITGICQIRLDLKTVVIQQPDSNGSCDNRDQFTVTQATDGKQLGTLCGTLTGQHSEY